MTPIAAESAKNISRKDSTRKAPGEGLDCRYREIGIPAVAAAVRDQRAAKDPAYAPVTARQERGIDAA